MTQFECRTSYLGKEVTVKSDDFAEMHQAIAKIDELNQDANFLARKTGDTNLSPNFRTDHDGNAYYGVTVKGRGPNVTFGKLRDGGLIPFFPKAEEGYYDPNNPSETRNVQRNAPKQQGSNGNRAPRQQQTSQQGPQRPEYAEDDDLPF